MTTKRRIVPIPERERRVEAARLLAASEQYAVRPERISEVIRLNVRKTTWAEIDIGDHMSAVLVFGATQEDADARAAWIASMCGRPALRRETR